MWLIGVYGSKKIQTCQQWYHPWLTNNFWGSFHFSNYVSIDFESYIPATSFSLPGLFIITNFCKRICKQQTSQEICSPVLISCDELSPCNLNSTLQTAFCFTVDAHQRNPFSFRLSAVMQMKLPTWAVLYIFIYKKWHCECKSEV